MDLRDTENVAPFFRPIVGSSTFYESLSYCLKVVMNETKRSPTRNLRKDYEYCLLTITSSKVFLQVSFDLLKQL